MEEGVGLRDAGTVTPARYCIAYQDYASKIIDTEYILNTKDKKSLQQGTVSHFKIMDTEYIKNTKGEYSQAARHSPSHGHSNRNTNIRLESNLGPNFDPLEFLAFSLFKFKRYKRCKCST